MAWGLDRVLGGALVARVARGRVFSEEVSMKDLRKVSRLCGHCHERACRVSDLRGWPSFQIVSVMLEDWSFHPRAFLPFSEASFFLFQSMSQWGPFSQLSK